MRSKRFFLILVGALTILSLAPVNSELVSDYLRIDTDNLTHGTVKVSIINSSSSNERYRLKVVLNDKYYCYELKPDEESTIPLQMGNGDYAFILYRQIEGKIYAAISHLDIELDIDENAVWLEPNVKVDFSSPDRLLRRLEKIVSPKDSEQDKIRKITSYVRKHFLYDWIRYTNGTPPPEKVVLNDVLDRGMGFCEELSALTVAFFRLEGIPSRLVIGKANGYSHAWVEILSKNHKIITFDPSVNADKQRRLTYLGERYY